MVELIEVLIGMVVLYFVIHWILIYLKYILLGMIGTYILFSIFTSLPYYIEAYKVFFKPKIKNNKIEIKSIISFFNINKIMFNKFFSDKIEGKILLFPGIIIFGIFHTIITIFFYLPYRLLITLFYTIFNQLDDNFLKNHFLFCRFCYKKSFIPLYKCSKCGIVHKNLKPSLEFGIFHHTCECGNKLPVYKNNREKLETICPFCQKELNSIYSMLTNKKIITFIGNEGVGKTAYVIKIINLILKDYSKSKFIETLDQSKFDKIFADINKKLLLEKTNDIQLYNILLNKNKLLYLFDIPGKIIKNNDNIINYDFLSSASIIVFIINPLEIQYIKEKFNKINDYKSLSDTLSRLTEILQQKLNLDVKSKINIPLSIIINKTEILNDLNIDDENIEKQLIDWREKNFVQILNTKFNYVKYYSFSVLKDNEKEILKPINLIKSI
jgi:hypothetical protein